MGKVIMSGIVPLLKAPVTGVLASSLAVGSTVKLMEGGTAVEYLVVNQGIPENSSLYDASCDGTWLLRKDIHSNRQWNTSNNNAYASSSINTWLNSDYVNGFGTIEQATIKQVKIPYCAGNNSTTINSGTNGLNTKVFLLGGYEVGFTTSTSSHLLADGAKLSYFESGTSASAVNKRIAYLNTSADNWWLRSPNKALSYSVYTVANNGYDETSGGTTGNYGIRPALILPSNALFDEATKLLKGVK